LQIVRKTVVKNALLNESPRRKQRGIVMEKSFIFAASGGEFTHRD